MCLIIVIIFKHGFLREPAFSGRAKVKQLSLQAVTTWTETLEDKICKSMALYNLKSETR